MAASEKNENVKFQLENYGKIENSFFDQNCDNILKAYYVVNFHTKFQIKIQIFSKVMLILVFCDISVNKVICFGTTSLSVI